MRYFLDTEFEDNGRTIELISIGIVAEDGREFYAENAEFNWNTASFWLWTNVFPGLKGTKKLNRFEIATKVLEFFAGDDEIELWGYFPSYDWVVFCQLFGRMVDIPNPLPHRINDLKQLLNSKKLKIKPITSHNALEDAKGIKELFKVVWTSE